MGLTPLFECCVDTLAHPGREVDDMGRLELLKNSLGIVHVPQVSVLAAEEDVLLVLLGLLGTRTSSDIARNKK